MVEEKKKSGSVVVTIFLILIIVGLIFYICYDKGLILKQENKKNSEETKEEVEKEEEKEEELDIHSSLVQELYNKVADESDEVSPFHFTPYVYGDNDGLEDFTSNGGNEIIKMKLVRKNLRKSDEDIIDCSKVPDKLESDPTYSSYCSYPDFQAYGYKRKTIERVYKDLFGNDSKLDTSIDLLNDSSFMVADKFVYINSIDMYAEYVIESGGMLGGSGYKTKLSKATKKGNRVDIYETVEFYGLEENNTTDMKLQDTFTFVYTFEQESSGNYKFVSRIKDKSSKIRLVENKDYFVKDEFPVENFDITKRGYYVDTYNEPNAPYFYIICMGKKDTKGYSLKIKEVNKVDKKTEIIVEEVTSTKNTELSPTIVVEFPNYQDGIIIKNTKGKEFTELKDY